MNLKNRTTQIIIIAITLLCIFPALLIFGLMSPYYDRPEIANLPVAPPTATATALVLPSFVETIGVPATGGEATPTPNPNTAPTALPESQTATPESNITMLPAITGPAEAAETPLDTTEGTPTAPNSPVGDIFGTVNTRIANLRAGPGTTYEVVSGARLGQVLQVYGKSADGQWLLIDQERGRWVNVALLDLTEDIAVVLVVNAVNQ